MCELKTESSGPQEKPPHLMSLTADKDPARRRSFRAENELPVRTGPHILADPTNHAVPTTEIPAWALQGPAADRPVPTYNSPPAVNVPEIADRSRTDCIPAQRDPAVDSPDAAETSPETETSPLNRAASFIEVPPPPSMGEITDNIPAPNI